MCECIYILCFPGYLPAVLRSAMVSPGGSGAAEERASSAPRLVRPSGKKVQRGERGAAERTPQALDEPTDQRGLQFALPRPAE